MSYEYLVQANDFMKEIIEADDPSEMVGKLNDYLHTLEKDQVIDICLLFASKVDIDLL